MRGMWVARARLVMALLVALGVVALPGGAQPQDKKPIVIAIPVGLSGVNSVVAPAVVQSAELAAQIAGSELAIIAGAGHLANMEEP